MPLSWRGTESSSSAPNRFSPKAHYLLDSEIELVWDRVGDGHRSHGEGWCKRFPGISVYNVSDLSVPAPTALGNLTRNTLPIPPGRTSIKTWWIEFQPSETVIHVPVPECVCLCVCVTLNLNTGNLAFLLSSLCKHTENQHIFSMSYLYELVKQQKTVMLWANEQSIPRSPAHKESWQTSDVWCMT